MIICIQPLEMWTGNIDPDLATYGENDQLLIEHFLKLGAKKVDSPIKTFYV